MSRGPGRVMRRVRDLLADSSDAHTYRHLACAVYNTDTPTRAQIGSAHRAVRRLSEMGEGGVPGRLGLERLVVGVPNRDESVVARVRESVAQAHDLRISVRDLEQDIWGPSEPTAKPHAAILAALTEIRA